VWTATPQSSPSSSDKAMCRSVMYRLVSRGGGGDGPLLLPGVSRQGCCCKVGDVWGRSYLPPTILSQLDAVIGDQLVDFTVLVAFGLRVSD